jgi:hypothetical protein
MAVTASLKPLVIDLFCGLGGWTDGLLAEGWRVIGYDIEAHEYGEQRYRGEFVLQDVLTIHWQSQHDPPPHDAGRGEEGMSAPYWPAMMKRATAARYCELTVPEFEREVAAATLPLPVKLGNHDHWSRVGLDKALALVIKAKLEAVEAGISLFENEFMANIMLPNGGIVGDWMRPKIEQAYLTGQMPQDLPLLTGPSS